MRTIRLVGVWPIPVGHQVEVTWFGRERASGGWFGKGETTTERLEVPRVRDLDSGIIYTHGALARRRSEGATYLNDLNVTAPGERAGLVVIESLVGYVRLCQLTIFNNEHTETWIDVEADA